MKENPLIKSKERVREHGEVFTPQWVVDKMLNQPGIKEATENLQATFLEPAAGEGAFLVEILNRRLNLAQQISHSINEYEENALIGLSTLYGIELLEDNVEMLVMNMMSEFERHYYQVIQDYSASYNKKVFQSAKVIISANMVQGDALTRQTADNTPIIFSEWKLLPKKHGKRRVQRLEFTFDAIIEQGDANQTVSQMPEDEQLDLFAIFSDEQPKEEETQLRYKEVSLLDVGQQIVEEVE